MINWKNKNKNSIVRLNNESESFSSVTVFFRLLSIVSELFVFSRVDRMLKKINKNTLIENFFSFRAKKFFVHHFANFERRAKNKIATTKREKLKFLLFEFFILKYIFNQIHIYVLLITTKQKRNKFFITKNISLNAFFWKFVCNMIYVETTMLHANLSNAKKINLISKFNDSTNFLTIFIIIYQISVQKINLNKCCSKMIVATSAVNASFEIQTWFKIIRVNHIEKKILCFSNRFEKWLIKYINFTTKFRCDYSRDDAEFTSSISRFQTNWQNYYEFDNQNIFFVFETVFDAIF